MQFSSLSLRENTRVVFVYEDCMKSCYWVLSFTAVWAENMSLLSQDSISTNARKWHSLRSSGKALQWLSNYGSYLLWTQEEVMWHRTNNNKLEQWQRRFLTKPWSLPKLLNFPGHGCPPEIIADFLDVESTRSIMVHFKSVPEAALCYFIFDGCRTTHVIHHRADWAGQKRIWLTFKIKTPEQTSDHDNSQKGMVGAHEPKEITKSEQVNKVWWPGRSASEMLLVAKTASQRNRTIPNLYC